MDAELFKKVIDLIGNDADYFTVRVRSFSMHPVLKDGDLVIAKKTKNIKRGNVVIFREGSFLVIHRVVVKLGPIVITRGDNQKKFDSPLLVDKIIGKVVAVMKSNNA